MAHYMINKEMNKVIACKVLCLPSAHIYSDMLKAFLFVDIDIVY